MRENAYGIEQFTFNLAIIHNCNFRNVNKVGNIVKQSWMIYCFSQFKESSYSKIRRLLKALPKNDLTISPKKCQLFKTELQYMETLYLLKIGWFVSSH